MHRAPFLKSGDLVEIIAPASRDSDQKLVELQQLLASWGLSVFTDPELFGQDVLCANSDGKRFDLLKNALFRAESKAIICVRGGYGSMRLIPALNELPRPLPKLFLGMSDATALHLFFQNKWQWSTVHTSIMPGRFSAESIALTKSVLFGETKEWAFEGQAWNQAASEDGIIQALLTGGNLCLVQTSIGTIWQVNAKDKILFLEEVGERAYRVDRMLEQLKQAGAFRGVKAIVFGDFLGGEEPNGSSLIVPVLKRFAEACSFPVVKIEGAGHGATNFPLFLGETVRLKLGSAPTFTAFIG